MVRLPDIYRDAKEMIENSFSKKNMLLSRYNSSLVKMCDVSHISIREESNDEKVGSLYLLLKYRERIITKYDKFETLNKTQNLRILTPHGDNIWPFLMVVKVWNGEYPSCVALNEETGVVYLIYLTNENFKLVEFSVLSASQLEAITESLNDINPYRIGIDDDAMFKVLSEIEGVRYLQSNVYIEFDCGVKFRVFSKNETELR